jgi:Spy/CpxP family protein refolding chaperone
MTRGTGANLAACLAILALLVLSSTASAQRGGRGFRWLFGASKAELATLPDVQNELKLTDEQKIRVTEIHDGLRDDRRALFGTGFGRFSEIRTKSEELNREAAKKVDELLDESQRTRLQQIFVQQNGPRSLLDPAVADSLGLSEEQKSKLAAAREENGRDFEAAFAQHGREWRQHARDLVAKGDERLLAVLTDEQRDRLETLKGEPLEIDMSQLRGPRGTR